MTLPIWCPMNSTHDRHQVGEMIFSFDVELRGGGVTRFTTGLVKNLDPQIINVTIYSLTDSESEQSKQRIKQLNSLGIRTVVCGPWFEDNPLKSFIKALKTLQTELKLRPVEILHSHSEFTDVVAVWLKLFHGIPIIIRTAHNGYWLEWRKRPLRRIFFTNFLFPLTFNAEIGVSPMITERLNRRWLARMLRRKALNIRNALDLDRFAQPFDDSINIKKSLSIPDSAWMIGTVGRLAEEKGYPYLIDAAALVLQKYPEAYFVIIGGGKLASELQLHARSRGIAEHIIFTGPRSDIESLLACMDIFVCSSLWEGLPTTVLEGMAAGVPVIASDIPGTRALIRHGENGWLVPPGNVPELAAAINHLLESPMTRQSLTINAAETIQNYSIERVAREYEALYSQWFKGHV